MEGSLENAIGHFQAALQSAECPRADRGNAALRLQSALLASGDIEGALGTYAWIERELNDEWGVRLASLSQFYNSELPGQFLSRLDAISYEFRRELGGAFDSDVAEDAIRSRSIVNELDSLSAKRSERRR